MTRSLSVTAYPGLLVDSAYPGFLMDSPERMVVSPHLPVMRPAARPPRHLADLSLAERRAAVAELGMRPFRADQLSRQYFARLVSDPAEMTDLPAASRKDLAGALLPRLLTAERELTCD